MDALPPQAQAVLQVPAYVAGSILSLTLTRVAFQVRNKGGCVQKNARMGRGVRVLALGGVLGEWAGDGRNFGGKKTTACEPYMSTPPTNRRNRPDVCHVLGRDTRRRTVRLFAGEGDGWQDGLDGQATAARGGAVSLAVLVTSPRPALEKRTLSASRLTLSAHTPHTHTPQLVSKVASLNPPVPGYAKLVRPHLRTLVGVVEGSLGPANKFVPSSTHVFLVAVLLALLLNAGGAVAKAPSRRR